MCRFLTGKARLQQTDKKRIWKLFDNELYKADDGNIYLVPRNMQTDNYTIPCWIAWLAGSPVDYDTRASHLHDLWCYVREALVVTLTEKEFYDIFGIPAHPFTGVNYVELYKSLGGENCEKWEKCGDSTTIHEDLS